MKSVLFKITAFFLFSNILLSSCEFLNTKKEYNLIVVLDNAKGLKGESEVLYKGIKVGKLSDVKRDGIEIIGILTFPNDFKIPINSLFTANQKSLFGKKSIEIEFSQEPLNYKDGDKVMISKSRNMLENIFKDMDINIDSTFGGALDSIAKEFEKMKDENAEVIMNIPKGEEK